MKLHIQLYIFLFLGSVLLAGCQPGFYHQRYASRHYVKTAPGENTAEKENIKENPGLYTPVANVNMPATPEQAYKNEKIKTPGRTSFIKDYPKNDTYSSASLVKRPAEKKLYKDGAEKTIKKIQGKAAGPEKAGRTLNTASFLTGLIAAGVMIAAIIVLIVSAIVGSGSIAPIIMFSISGILAIAGLLCGIFGVKMKGELIGLGYAGIIVTGLVLLISLIFFLTILL